MDIGHDKFNSIERLIDEGNLFKAKVARIEQCKEFDPAPDQMRHKFNRPGVENEIIIEQCQDVSEDSRPYLKQIRDIIRTESDKLKPIKVAYQCVRF